MPCGNKDKCHSWRHIKICRGAYHGAQGACLILHWIMIETLALAQGAGSQEICWWKVRIWSLGNPSTKSKKEKKMEWGTKNAST